MQGVSKAGSSLWSDTNGMTRPLNSASFKYRVISGFVLGPVTLAAIILGGLFFQFFVAIAFGLSVKEWIRMAGGSHNAALFHKIRDIFIGVVYLALSYAAFLKLRLDFDQGVFLTFCLVLGVWASDIGAYFAGKLIGGPKMAPKISPNKTWAGLIGGAIASTLTLLFMNYGMPVLVEHAPIQISVVQFLEVGELLVVGVFFTLFGQVGDLLMSSYKRRAQVKDTGNLIPGHGGLLDRIDSLLLVTPFFLIVLSELYK